MCVVFQRAICEAIKAPAVQQSTSNPAMPINRPPRINIRHQQLHYTHHMTTLLFNLSSPPWHTQKKRKRKLTTCPTPANPSSSSFNPAFTASCLSSLLSAFDTCTSLLWPPPLRPFPPRDPPPDLRLCGCGASCCCSARACSPVGDMAGMRVWYFIFILEGRCIRGMIWVLGRWEVYGARLQRRESSSPNYINSK